MNADFWLLKDARRPALTPVDAPDETHDDPFEGIRCPRCGWRPEAASRWHCVWTRGPEPFFQSCGMVWNTFTTRGRCPGCRHQWLFTDCLHCHEPSLHEDWYEQSGRLSTGS